MIHYLLKLKFGFNFVAQTDPLSPKNGIIDKYVPTYVFKNAIIHVSSQETIDDGTLVIKGDKIVAVGQGIKFPENSLVFDLEGKHIYHSFIELNSHFGIKKTTKKSGHQLHNMSLLKLVLTIGTKQYILNIKLKKIIYIIKKQLTVI